MKVIACVAVLLALAIAANAQTGAPICNAPDVESVQRVIGQQGDRIRALEAQNLQLQRQVQDLNRRLWDVLQRQHA